MNFPLLIFTLLMILPGAVSSQNILTKLLEENKEFIGPVLEMGEQFEVQIIYTQIERDENNIPHFKTHSFNLNDNYFYPASTIKMPAAFLALEKINNLNINNLDKYSIIKNEAGSAPQTLADTDSSAENNLPSIAHYIKKIFLVSDNDANNRLYEFLGQKYLNQQLYNKGFRNSRIIHRLGANGAAFSFESNKTTNPISMYNGEDLLYYQGEVTSEATWDFQLKNEVKGKGYMRGGKLVNEPFDFRKKNYISLMDLHNMLQAVIFPESVPEYSQFDLTPEDYKFLYHWMSAKPRESKIPFYDEPDGYVKFFMYEGKEENIPDHIRIFNKVGYAYGYLTDVAYIIDTEANIEFLLAATIHINANETFNDNVYEYDTIGLPFLKKLGDIIYEYEKKRERKFKPDLSKYIRD